MPNQWQLMASGAYQGIQNAQPDQGNRISRLMMSALMEHAFRSQWKDHLHGGCVSAVKLSLRTLDEHFSVEWQRGGQGSEHLRH